MSLPKAKKSFEEAKATSLPLALAVRQKAHRKHTGASSAPAEEPKEVAHASLAEAIIAKRKAKATQPPPVNEFESAEDPAVDAYDLLDDGETLEAVEPPKNLVDRIRARMKARRGY